MWEKTQFNTSVSSSRLFFFLEDSRDTFLEINDSPEILPCILSETAKAVKTAKIIYSSHKRKLKK